MLPSAIQPPMLMVVFSVKEGKGFSRNLTSRRVNTEVTLLARPLGGSFSFKTL
jgi:hypothetical protein